MPIGATPRIKKVGFVWTCQKGMEYPRGTGLSPHEAYLHWLFLVRYPSKIGQERAKYLQLEDQSSRLRRALSGRK